MCSAVRSSKVESSDKLERFETDMIYKLEDNPPLMEKIFAALQHISAIFVSIIAPGYIITTAINADLKTKATVMSMCLLFSGIATFMQSKRSFGYVGSGLLSIQGTSFAFLGVLITTGKIGGVPLIMGTCLIGSLIPIIFAPYLRKLKRFFPPLVSGIVVFLIGATLMPVAIDNFAGGTAAKLNGTYGDPKNIILGAIVLLFVIIFQKIDNKILRIGSILFASVIGFLIAIPMGLVNFSVASNSALFSIPVPMQLGLTFGWATILPVIIIYFVSCVEAIGDITATAMISGEPIRGDKHMSRMSGGIFASGICSFFGSFFGAMPLACFSQNNGIIQITGVASRHVGYYIAGFLIIAGLIPVVSVGFSIIPPPVIGGALLMMFGTILAAGIKILSTEVLDRRAFIIIATAVGCGFAVTYPGFLDKFPDIIKDSLSSGIGTGGLVAIIMNIVIPKEKSVLTVKRQSN
ncbi:MAG TPA: nucleobase:cation symporter-2 family protein [Victivallales bacterium]|nr:nucleobase:cation symporter-2 family protein [Victivallales bacterium]